jgi:hypothetical protein
VVGPERGRAITGTDNGRSIPWPCLTVAGPAQGQASSLPSHASRVPCQTMARPANGRSSLWLGQPMAGPPVLGTAHRPARPWPVQPMLVPTRNWASPWPGYPLAGRAFGKARPWPVQLIYVAAHGRNKPVPGHKMAGRDHGRASSWKDQTMISLTHVRASLW